jgi:hypothetical protein
VQYKVVFFAKPNQGAITPLATGEILRYSSKFNYQKIYKQGTASPGATIAHNLGYVPKVRAWYVPSSNNTPLIVQVPANCLATPDWWNGNGGVTFPNIDSTNAYLGQPLDSGSSNVPGTWIYRIYLDS